MGQTESSIVKKFLAAAGSGDMDVLRDYLDYGIDVNVSNKYGVTALLQACEKNQTEAINELLLRGAHTDIRDFDGWSPLLKASQFGYLDIMQTLLEYDVDVNVRSRGSGCFPLKQAAFWGFERCVECLLDNGANVNMADNRMGTALYFAASNGHYTVVELLLKAGARPNVALDDRSTPLYTASQNGHGSVITKLLAAGAYTEIQHDSEATALITACNNNQLSAVKLLCQAGCNINAATNRRGDTALHFVASKGHAGVAEYLLEHGALAIRNKKGREPLHYAIKRNHFDLVKLLVRYKLPNTNVFVKEQNKENERILHENFIKITNNEAQVLEKAPEIGDTAATDDSELVTGPKVLVIPDIRRCPGDTKSIKAFASCLNDEISKLRNHMEESKESMTPDYVKALSEELQDILGSSYGKAEAIQPLGSIKELFEHITNISIRNKVSKQEVCAEEELKGENSLLVTKLTNKWELLTQFLDIPNDRITKVKEEFMDDGWVVLVEWIDGEEENMLKEATVKIDLKVQGLSSKQHSHCLSSTPL